MGKITWLITTILVIFLLLPACEKGQVEPPSPISKTAPLVVAAANSPESSKKLADYVCDGVDDQVEIQAALDSLIKYAGKEEFTVSLDEWVELKHESIQSTRYPTEYVVTVTGDGITYSPSTDYELDSVTGTIKCLSTGNMVAGSTCYIQYHYGSGRVLLLNGKYMITNYLTIWSHITLSGQGTGTIITQPDGEGIDNEPLIVMRDHTVLENLTIDGNARGVTNVCNGVMGGSYSIIRGCRISHIPAYAVSMYCSKGFRVLDNEVCFAHYGINTNGEIEEGLSAIHGIIQGNVVHHMTSLGMKMRDTEHCIVDGNTFYRIAKNCIRLGESTTPARYITVSNNSMYGDGSAGTAGVAIDQDSSVGNLITGNSMYGFEFGILGVYGEADIIGNEFVDITGQDIKIWAGFRGSIINNRFLNDGYIHFYEFVETIEVMGNNNQHGIMDRHLVKAKNKTGDKLVTGDVVTFKPVSWTGDPIEIYTTTAKGDARVFGMVAEPIEKEATGLVLITGPTVSLKVNGIEDIAPGDLLCTYTEAGIACKAGAGDMAFAIAMETYTEDNSQGIIDAHLITPRKL